MFVKGELVQTDSLKLLILKKLTSNRGRKQEAQLPLKTMPSHRASSVQNQDVYLLPLVCPALKIK